MTASVPLPNVNNVVINRFRYFMIKIMYNISALANVERDLFSNFAAILKVI